MNEGSLSPNDDAVEMTDTRLREWIRARLDNKLLDDEPARLKFDFPPWTDLGSLLDQAVRPDNSGLDRWQAGRILRLAANEISFFLRQKELAPESLVRCLRLTFHACEMSGCPRVFFHEVGPPIIDLLKKHQKRRSTENAKLLKEILAAASMVAPAMDPELIEPLFFQSEFVPWLLPFLRANPDRSRHPGMVARALANVDPESPEEDALLLWTETSLPAARDRWRKDFEEAADKGGLDRHRARNWLQDLGVVSEAKPREDEAWGLAYPANRLTNLYHHHVHHHAKGT